jgi:hypothetical protein
VFLPAQVVEVVQLVKAVTPVSTVLYSPAAVVVLQVVLVPQDNLAVLV